MAACGIVTFLAFLFSPAVAADRPSRDERLLLWLLGLKTAREHEDPRIDINAATVEELQAVPGMERDQALRIIAQRPYATLQDLARPVCLPSPSNAWPGSWLSIPAGRAHFPVREGRRPPAE